MSNLLTPSRMEAFADGVIAVISTIMVLEFKVPSYELSNLEGLHHVLPMLVIYVLSFGFPSENVKFCTVGRPERNR